MIHIFYINDTGQGCHEWINKNPFSVIAAKSNNNVKEAVDLADSKFECFISADSYNNIFNTVKNAVKDLLVTQVKDYNLHLYECSLTNHGSFVQAEFKIRKESCWKSSSHKSNNS